MYVLESDAGYMIRVTPAQPEGEWVYLSRGPKHKIEKVGNCVMFEGLEYKTKYGPGDEVPPAYDYRSKSARRLVGGFHSKRHGSADAALVAAKASCEQHRDQHDAL